MGCSAALRQEFKLSNFRLDHPEPTLFLASQVRGAGGVHVRDRVEEVYGGGVGKEVKVGMCGTVKGMEK